jgi:integrase
MLLLTAIQTGVRVSELVNLTIASLALGCGVVRLGHARTRPGRPSYANRNGQLIPERLDPQLPASDNARLPMKAFIRTFR